MLAREADNFFALMPDPAGALECGRALLSEVAKSNGGLPADKRLAVSIGVGHGDVLMIERGLMYGDEMNLVCKVGEDLAGPDEILLTPAAREALGPAHGDFEERRLSISGLDVTAYRPLAQPGAQLPPGRDAPELSPGTGSRRRATRKLARLAGRA